MLQLAARGSPVRMLGLTVVAVAGIMPEGSAPSGTKLVAIDILKFQREPGGTVVLDGSWTVSTAGSDDPGIQHPLELKTPVVQDGAAAQAHAMSQLVGLLADTIASEYSH